MIDLKILQKEYDQVMKPLIRMFYAEYFCPEEFIKVKTNTTRLWGYMAAGKYAAAALSKRRKKGKCVKEFVAFYDKTKIFRKFYDEKYTRKGSITPYNGQYGRMFFSYYNGMFIPDGKGFKFDAGLPTVYQFSSIEEALITVPKFGKELEQYFETGLLFGKKEFTYDEFVSLPYWEVLYIATDARIFTRYLVRYDSTGSIHTRRKSDVIFVLGDPSARFSNDVKNCADTLCEYLQKCDMRRAKALQLYRQLTLYYYKLEVDPSPDMVLKATYEFIDNDKQNNRYARNKCLYFEEVKEFIHNFFSVNDDENYVLSFNDGKISYRNFPWFREDSGIIASYSPGATAVGNKYLSKRWIQVPDQLRGFALNLGYELTVPKGDKVPAVLDFVPKDGRGPRIIAKEPGYSNLATSIIQKRMYERLKDFGIDLENQDNNRYRALHGSLSRKFATIDLKHASDNIAKALVLDLLPDSFREIFDLFSTGTVQLPDKYVYDLQMFATMGNKLTFPVQTLIFLAIVHATYKAVHATAEEIGEILVYGDDIIVHSKYYANVIQALQSYNLIPNLAKSFVKGYFRESCGIFALYGFNVNCVYRRKVELTVDHVNQLLMTYGYLPAMGLPRFKGLEGYVQQTPTLRDIESFVSANLRYNLDLYRFEYRTSQEIEISMGKSNSDESPLLMEWLRNNRSKADLHGEKAKNASMNAQAHLKDFIEYNHSIGEYMRFVPVHGTPVKVKKNVWLPLPFELNYDITITNVFRQLAAIFGLRAENYYIVNRKFITIHKSQLEKKGKNMTTLKYIDFNLDENAALLKLHKKINDLSEQIVQRSEFGKAVSELTQAIHALSTKKISKTNDRPRKKVKTNDISRADNAENKTKKKGSENANNK